LGKQLKLKLLDLASLEGVTPGQSIALRVCMNKYSRRTSDKYQKTIIGGEHILYGLSIEEITLLLNKEEIGTKKLPFEMSGRGKFKYHIFVTL
jgi:hypothetical protein